MAITKTDQRNYCKISHTAITNTDQKNEDRKWTAKHEQYGNFQNMATALTSILKEVMEDIYQSHWGRIGSTKTGVCLMSPPVILAHI